MKIIRDPIHDIIEVDGRVLKLLDSRPFQRLRGIKQLGVCSFVYPSAEHSRFTHSLGVYHVAKRIMKQVNIKEDKDCELIQIAALLHDIGHIAFSHTLESVVKDLQGNFEHEDYSIRIINEDTEISKILGSRERENICRILLKEYENNIAVSIISSQFDADRLDYLIRDSYMTGANYGNVDLEWLIRNLYIARTCKETSVTAPEKVMAIDGEKGLNVLEQYLLGRFYMYKHVYLHKVIRGFEAIVRSIFKRFFYLNNRKLIGYKLFRDLKDNRISLDNFYNIDDNFILFCFRDWYKSTRDKILKELIAHFLYRKPFKEYDPPENRELYIQKKEQAQQLIKKKYGRGADEFYLLVDKADANAYEDFFDIKRITDEVFIFSRKTGFAYTLSSMKEESIIISEAKSLKLNESRWFLPKDIREQIK